MAPHPNDPSVATASGGHHAPHRNPNAPGASVGTRTSVLLAAALAVCVFIFVQVQQSQRSQVDFLLRERTNETARVLTRILDLRASGARMHADDYTRWDEFVAFTRKPTATWARVNLTENIGTFGVDGAWVLDDGYRVLFTANPSGAATLQKPPVPLAELAAALRAQPIRHFFVTTSGGTMEVWTSSIQPSDDLRRQRPPSGYYVIGRLWTPERLADLARVTGGTARLTSGGSEPAGSSASSRNGEIHVVVPLPGLDGRPASLVIYETTFPVAPRVHDALSLSLILLLGTGVVSFFVVAAVLAHWVARPLRLITESLRSEDPSLLDRTVGRRDEFGQLAWLVREFFAQRASLIQARQEAEAGARAKQRFVTTISHELRTPMHGVLSFARFGAQEAATAEREELVDYFRQIDTSGSRLISLLDELLDLAKIDAGMMAMEFGPCPIGELAREAAAEFAGVCLEKKLKLDIRIAPGAPSAVLDRGRIQQVLRNLLANAAKFTPPGETIALVVEASDQVALIAVEDSGAGIPPAELELIFGKFSQATNNKRASGGTGLGLALCREIVAAHGGRIWAENRAPKGARMVLELPVGGPEAATVRHVERRSAAPSLEEPGKEAA